VKDMCLQDCTWVLQVVVWNCSIREAAAGVPEVKDGPVFNCGWCHCGWWSLLCSRSMVIHNALEYVLEMDTLWVTLSCGLIKALLVT
jgi:hypothetical protein